MPEATRAGVLMWVLGVQGLLCRSARSIFDGFGEGSLMSSPNIFNEGVRGIFLDDLMILSTT